MNSIDYVMQVLKGEYKFGSIDEFLVKKNSIISLGGLPQVFLEGQYFLSYDYVFKLYSTPWDGAKLVQVWKYQYENVKLRHFGGNSIDIEMSFNLHANVVGEDEHINDMNIFEPEFSYDGERELLCLEGFELVPRKPRNNRIKGLMRLLPAFGGMR